MEADKHYSPIYLQTPCLISFFPNYPFLEVKVAPTDHSLKCFTPDVAKV